MFLAIPIGCLGTVLLGILDLTGVFEPGPPEVGETIEQVLARLGAPYYDSRKSKGDGDDRYDVCIGTTRGMILHLFVSYHLRVEDRRVAAIDISSR